MDRFYVDAENILTTAVGVLASGQRPTEMVILTGVRGQIQLLAECDWPLESIRTERGATSAYRISSRNSTVFVDGNQPGRSCRLQQSVASMLARPQLLSPALSCWSQVVPPHPRLPAPSPE